MLKIIAKNVTAKLEKIVTGKVSCRWITKQMICIEVSNEGFSYKYNRWYNKIELGGLNSTDIVGEFLDCYISHIRNKFFKF